MEKGNEIKTVVPALRFPEFQGMNGWEEKKLEEIGNFIGGGTPNTAIQEYWDGGIPWYTPTEIKNGDLKSSNRTITEKGLKNSSAKLLPQGAILITTRATIGDVAISKKECTTNQGFQSLVVNDSESNLFWFYWIIRHKEELIKRASGSTFKEISKNEIINITSYSPKKQEQQKIAACLSSLDELIEVTAHKVEALKEHKKGLMQRLFPAEGKNVPDLRFPEFQGTQVWEDAILGTVADYENGKAHENEIDEDGDFIVVNSKFISTDGEVIKRTNTPYCLADKEDILMVLSDVPNGRAIAKCFFVDESGKYTVNQRICRLQSKSINSKFLFYLINRNPYFLSFDDGVKQTNLKKSEVLECPLMIPSSPIEQQKIANLLSSIDDLIIATEQRIKSLEKHKKGLMQQLFPKI